MRGGGMHLVVGLTLWIKVAAPSIWVFIYMNVLFLWLFLYRTFSVPFEFKMYKGHLVTDNNDVQTLNAMSECTWLYILLHPWYWKLKMSKRSSCFVQGNVIAFEQFPGGCGCDLASVTMTNYGPLCIFSGLLLGPKLKNALYQILSSKCKITD